MGNEFTTPQEEFWAGDFGDRYVERNSPDRLMAASIAFFSKILSRTSGVKSIIEFGANIGINLRAIKQLVPDVELSAVEINQKAVAEMDSLKYIKTYNKSILEFDPDYKRELSLIRGVLIHINPDYLAKVYDALYRSTNRYICIAEYYNPVPVELNYRGHEGRLFKRDFAGEIMDKFADLEIVDYGFVYHRDNNFEQDDITWFLLQKK